MINGTRQNYKVLLPGLLLGLVSLLLLAFLGNIEQLGTFFGSFKWSFFLLALGMTVLYHLLRFLNLNFSLNITGIRKISFSKRLIFYLSGSALNATDHAVNESFKNIWVSKTCGIPYSRVDSVLLIDDISASLSIFVLVILGVIVYPTFLAVLPGAADSVCADGAFLAAQTRQGSMGWRSVKTSAFCVS